MQQSFAPLLLFQVLKLRSASLTGFRSSTLRRLNKPCRLKVMLRFEKADIDVLKSSHDEPQPLLKTCLAVVQLMEVRGFMLSASRRQANSRL